MFGNHQSEEKSGLFSSSLFDRGLFAHDEDEPVRKRKRGKRKQNDTLHLSALTPTLMGMKAAQKIAARRGHERSTFGAGMGGLLGGVIGSFLGPLGAAIGAFIGANWGAKLGRRFDP